LATLFVVAAAAWLRLQPEPGPLAPEFRIVNAAEETLERTLRVTGQLGARKTATMVAPALRGSRGRSYSSSDFRLILGQVLPPGARVRPGDVVARFDPQYMATRVDDQRADVEERKLINRRIDASTEIRRLQLDHRIRAGRASLEKAILDVKTIPVRSAIAAERFRLDEQEARARLRELLVQREYFDQSERSQLRREELALQEVNNDLRRAEVNLARMTFRSPIQGVVVMGQTQRGSEMSEIGDGDEVRAGNAFMQVMDPDSLYLEAVANQADQQILRPGARAVIRLDAVPEVEMPGRVHAVGATAVSNRYRPHWVGHLSLRIHPDRVDHRALPNFSASADIVTGSERGVSIARDCLKSLAGEPALDLAVRMEEGGLVRQRRTVRLGLASNTRVIVRSGLRAGDAVACP
jgi:multidrug efflux pump subunit AcrA (membrane-fusion protein)